VFNRLRARLHGDRRRCPLCFEGLTASAELRTCAACDTSYHPACFDELGGCSTTGCAAKRQRVVGARPAIEPDPPSTLLSSLFLGGFGGALMGALAAYHASASLLSAMRPTPLVAGALVGVAVGEVISRISERAARRFFGACVGLGLGTVLGLIVLVCIAASLWDSDPPLEPNSALLVELPILIALAGAFVTAWFTRVDDLDEVARPKDRA
jgi:hypothetical protein